MSRRHPTFRPLERKSETIVSDLVSVEVPTVGESISEVQIGQWLKSEGDHVAAGEDLVEIETEKASVQIPAPVAGVLTSIQKKEEEFATVGEVIASIQPGEAPAGGGGGKSASSQSAAPTPAPAAPSPAPASSAPAGKGGGFVMPAAQRLLDEHGLRGDQVPATGPGGRLLKEDVVAYIRSRPSDPAPSAAPATTRPGGPTTAASTTPAAFQPPAAPMTPAQRPTIDGSLMTSSLHRGEEVKPMSMLRRTIAARLVEAQQTAALLTTFNEINMQPVMDIRNKYKQSFHEKHGVKLGFMSFFAKASVEALRRFPAVNAEIRDANIVYKNYQDIGIAIGGGKGLVVPILRNVERMSFAEIERSIGDYARQAGENRLQPADLMGGTFTISNGGIYGSLLSTPIVNPPQSGILGLHAIQERPVAEDGQVVIRPMMYVALTYDHRIVDGREAVGFLTTIKEVIEDPARMFLEV